MISEKDLEGMFVESGLVGSKVLSGSELERFERIKDEIKRGLRPRMLHRNQLTSVFKPPLPHHFE